MNRKKYSFDFVESTSPIVDPVTKFGGQPVWIGVPEWPISRETGKPMTFICQIELAEEIFGPIITKMAYIFMSEYEDEYVNATWDSSSGENAVVLQAVGSIDRKVAMETGPSIQVWKSIPGEKLRKPFPCEFGILRSTVELDPEVIADEFDFENKVGGVANFLQNEEYPDGDKHGWNLLLQLNSCNVPFEINFGDAGIGYAFISNDGSMGKFLWQCA